MKKSLINYFEASAQDYEIRTTTSRSTWKSLNNVLVFLVYTLSKCYVFKFQYFSHSFSQSL